MDKEDNKNWKSIFPNTVSMGNLLCGVFSIFILLSNNSAALLPFYPNILAPSLIIIAGFLDSLDGTLARFFKTESELGKHLDSFADLATFGIAPSCLLYNLLFSQDIIYFDSKILTYMIYTLVSSLFPTAVAYRLARFHKSKDSRYFSGLPSTVGGGLLAVLYILSVRYDFGRIIFIPLILFISLLMVSNIQYPSYRLIFRSYFFNIFRLILLFGYAIFVSVFMGVYWFLCITGALYVSSGCFILIFSWIQIFRIHFKNH